MGYKAYITVLLWHLGRRKILPSDYVNQKTIRENNSPLVDISHNPFFSFDQNALSRGGLWVRHELASKLQTAAANLPDGIKLHLFCGWRHIAVQWDAWEKNLAEKRAKFPLKTETELTRLARMTSADPSRGGFGPHQTGGAVDLTLIQDGILLDMGTKYGHHGVEAQTDYALLNPQQRQNRNILLHAMQKAGFQNYPGEWWHYSYGDRAWAAYQRRPYAIFNRIDNPDYKLKPAEEKWRDK